MSYCLYVVVPCFNEEAVLKETTSQICQILSKMADESLISNNSRILYVDDGSTDNTWSIIDECSQKYGNICGIKLAANYGHQNALMAGLEMGGAKADIIITVDADLQDDISLIPEMVQRYNEGYDIVCGVRSDRDNDSFLHRACAYGFYRFMNLLGTKTIFNHADFRLMSKRAVLQLCKYRERNIYLRGMILKVGYRHTCVYYSRKKRVAGESHYSYSKLVGLAVEGITSFSIKPLRYVFVLGMFFVLLSLAIFVYVIWGILAGRSIGGWPSIILSIWLVGGCLLIGMGVVGEYIGKIYMEVKGRPRYNIEIIKGLD